MKKYTMNVYIMDVGLVLSYPYTTFAERRRANKLYKCIKKGGYTYINPTNVVKIVRCQKTNLKL